MKMRRVLVAAALMAAPVGMGCGRSPEPVEGPPFQVVETSIAEIQDAIRSGKNTCRGIVEKFIDRIETYDRPKGLNAITVINPKALQRAEEIDRALAEGRSLGPLFCAPLLVKDNFDTQDLPTTGGSVALKDSLPPDDAFMVARIREADAIIVAKTNMAEWAFSPRQSVSSSYGVTANAYALDRVPAGSSGGTASGVAASFGVAGLGSDTGNSIRGPSSHLALFGIRSTIGLTSRDGVIPLAFDRDIAGPMTRSVEDGARLFNVVAGYDPNDSFTEKDKRQDDYTAFLKADGLQGARIGVLRALVDTEDADARVTELFNKALEDMKAAGAALVDPVVVPGFGEHLQDRGFCQRFRYDMFVYLRSLGDKAPFLDVMSVLETGQFHESSKRALEFFGRGPLETAPEDADPPCLPYLENPRRRAYLEAVTAAMDGAGVEVLVYPTWTNPPAHLHKAREEYKGDNSQLVAPATGMPAASVPMGYIDGVLPAGLQILARRYDEGVIFRIAFAYEQATRHRKPPPEFPPLPE